jgi:predicted RNA binding protein YcfA (HicA-like mRNA interferase family)
MMSVSGLSMLKPREAIRALERMGFRLLRNSQGSHRQIEHPDGRRVTIPVHRGCEIGPGLLRKILRDIELQPQEFRLWLRGGK